MACCALAAFLIGHILLGWGRVRLWLGNRPAVRSAMAAEWAPSARSPLPTDNNRVRHRLGVLLAGLGLMGFAGAAVAAGQPRTVELGDTGIHAQVCGHVTGFFEVPLIFWSK